MWPPVHQRDASSHSKNPTSCKVSDDKMINENEEYEKIKHLGDGSFSTVSLYRKVNHKSDHRQLVALKKLNIDSSFTSLNRKEVEQAINEIKILSILKHENIINYYGSFMYENNFYIETEYADAGTLAEFLSSLSVSLEEIEILVIFVQIVSAVCYLHQRNIIHRDIKTTNIFLNKQGFIKLGDFGISKILDSKLDARSFVGTPFYICPEIFEGKTYNKPCDIWALGCVLYEMTSLHRTFDAKNLSALMHKVLKGSYMPINNKYSKRFHKLVSSLLQKNPTKRISSSQLFDKVNMLLNKLSALETTILNGNTNKDIYASESLREYIQKKSAGNTVRCSYLFHLDIFCSNLTLAPVSFPRRIHLKQLIKGRNHFLALSADNKVFAWGIGEYGELGLGRAITRLDNPRQIESLRNYSVNKISAGNGFSVFITKNGLVLTCGNHSIRCLGHEEKQDLFEPKLLNSLIKVNIFEVDCGPDHVVVVSSEGVAYAWGSNMHGKLGIQDPRRMAVIEPTLVVAPDNVKFKKVFCGPNATALLDYFDNLWLCGNNQYNKLAINKVNLFGSHMIEFADSLQRAHLPGKSKSVYVSLSEKHTLFFQENGKVLAAGDNQHGQLGQKHTSSVPKAAWASIPRHHKLKSVAAGSKFSLALTQYNLFFWGTRQVLSCPFKGSRSPSPVAKEFRNDEFIIGKCNESLMDIVQTFGPDYPVIKINEPKPINRFNIGNSNNSIILNAQNILELFSPKKLQTGEIHLSDIYCFADDSVFVVIESLQYDASRDPLFAQSVLLSRKNEPGFSNLPAGSATTTKHSYAWVNDN